MFKFCIKHKNTYHESGVCTQCYPNLTKCVVCDKECTSDDSKFVATSGWDGEIRQWCHRDCYNTWIGWNR